MLTPAGALGAVNEEEVERHINSSAIAAIQRLSEAHPQHPDWIAV